MPLGIRESEAPYRMGEDAGAQEGSTWNMLYRGPLPLRAAGYSTDPEGHSWSYYLFTLPPATYRCQKCGYSWSQDPQPLLCPVCHNLYVDWLNFDDWDTVKTAIDAEEGPTGLGHHPNSRRRPQ